MTSATPAPAPEVAQAPTTRLEQARALFRSGVSLLDTGDYERALDYFLRSRESYPSPQNTIDAALCLDRLGRYDESLEMYESALATLSDKLDAQDSAAIAGATAALLEKVANLEVSANVSGTVVVDGRPRGKLPLSAPIRALGGTHLVRIVKDGYRTFETNVTVRPGERARIDGELTPLEAAGQLRIEDPGHDGADVLVDGAVVGPSPWEGTLGPGAHVVWSRAGDTGSAPTSVIVLQGQTALVRLRSGPLGPPVRIEARPETATIELSGVPVGAGAFESRLPLGAYTVQAKEPGYFTRDGSFAIVAGDSAPVRLTLALVVSPNDPRWPQPVTRDLGHFWVGAFGGAAWGPSFGSAVEAGCPASCSGTPHVFGGIAGLRAGFRFRFETSIELSGAYWSMGLSSSRTRTSSFQDSADGSRVPVTYQLHDDVRYAGPFVGFGASQRIHLPGTALQLVPRATVGVLFGNVRNPVTGTATTSADSAAVQIPFAGTSVSATRAVLAPELGLVLPWKDLTFGLAIQAAFFAGPSVTFPYTTVDVDPGTVCASNARSAECARSYSGIFKEQALSPFYVLLPLASVSWQF